MTRKLHSIRKSLLAAVSAALGFAALPASAETYEYDALGRLTKVTYDDGSSITYVYDENGNRTQVIVDIV